MSSFFWLLPLLISVCTKTFVNGQPLVGECETAPHWTVDGRNVMNENRGNVTLVALMELHCSFCRSQIEGFVGLSKMLKNQSVNEVQFVIVAPWNESTQYVEYFRRYLQPSGIRVVHETAQEPVWSTIKGNKDDFLVYDACGRLSYYIPYPQSYLYYHYTVSTLYSTLRQEKCGACKFIGALEQKSKSNNDCDRKPEWQLLMKIRAYLNTMTDHSNTTTYHHYFGPTDSTKTDQQTSGTTGPASTPVLTTAAPITKVTTTKAGRKRLSARERERERARVRAMKTTTTTTTPSTTTVDVDSNELETTTVLDEDLLTIATKSPVVPTPVLVSVVSGEEEGQEEKPVNEKRVVPGMAEADRETVQVSTAKSATNADESTAQIPATTVGTSATVTDADIASETPTEADGEGEYYVYEDEDPTATDRRLNGGGAVGAVGASVIGGRKKIFRKRINGTTFAITSSSTTTTTTSIPATTTTTRPITTSWSTDPKPMPSTESSFRRPFGTTRVPKLPADIDCTPYTTSMCYRQWQEFGTLHTCCQRGVYLTDMCKAPLCNNATFHLCCFQKYQQARFQCCYDTDLPSEHPDDFSRCCYNHFVFDDDGNGDNDDQCCPRSIASYFWTTQTRVAELCLPNVELDLEGIVLDARMSDKSLVRIALQESTALQYECPYVDKRQDFFYWEPEGTETPDSSRVPKTTTIAAPDVDVPE